jgi:NitT/TauT family transport system permease protein
MTSKLRTRRYWSTQAWRVAIVAALLLGWQYLPQVEFFSSRFKWLNPFFVSSPTLVYDQIGRLMTGDNNTAVVWPYLLRTLEGTLIGTAIGVTLGAVLGALLSNYDRLSEILSVFVTVLNAVPRIALIPVIVIIFGTGVESAVVTCVLVVFFLAFFNAFEGGRSVPRPVLQNARVLGASNRQIMLRVRFPYVVMWVFAMIPNAVTSDPGWISSPAWAVSLKQYERWGVPGLDVGNTVNQYRSSVDMSYLQAALKLEKQKRK